MNKALVLMVFAGMAMEASGQSASALLREGDTLNQGTITSLGNVTVNSVGGFGVGGNFENDTESVSFHWGNGSAGAGSVLRTEGTFGDLQQNSFESFWSLNDNGTSFYSASTDNTATGETGLDGVWLGDTVVSNENDAFGSQFITFGSRPTNTDSNGGSWWVGGLADTPSGSSTERAIFRFDGSTVTSIIGAGTTINSTSGAVGNVDAFGSIDFDFNVSADGSNLINLYDIAGFASTADNVVAINDQAVEAGGGILMENMAIGAGVGGLAGEAWDNFDFMDVNNAGDVFITGDTNGATATDEFVFMNGQIIAREGDTVSRDGSDFTLSGSIEGGKMNENGDWAVIWDADNDAAINLEALIVNGDLIMAEGDLVDWNGDGVIDAGDDGATIDNFTGINNLTITDQFGDGTFDIYFTADANLDTAGTLEGYFKVTVPAPAGVAMLGLAGFASARRRRV